MVSLKKCEIQLSYAIGVTEPTSVMVDTSGTGADAGEVSMDGIVYENFKLTPDGIIETLNLRYASYKETAKYGHFCIDCLPWKKPIKSMI